MPRTTGGRSNDGFDRVSGDLRRDERLFNLLEIPLAQRLDRDLVGERAGARVHAVTKEVIVAQSGHVLPGEIDWFSRQGGWQVLPLRQLSDPTDSRVMAYRKQARAGILPPVLLWWISSLDCYVILDGHDRILAAVAEEQEPSFIALASVNRQRIDSHSQAVVDRYLAEQQLIPSSATDALMASNRRLAWTLDEIHTDYDRTRAWILPGGSPAWDALAQAHDPAWSDHINQLIADEH